jgi:hypothetical protein
VKGSVRKSLGALLRTLAGSDVLEELPETPGERARESFLAWLVKPERLPVDEPGADRPRKTLSSLIFAPERLPRDERPGAGDAGSGRPGAGRAA